MLYICCPCIPWRLAKHSPAQYTIFTLHQSAKKFRGSMRILTLNTPLLFIWGFLESQSPKHRSWHCLEWYGTALYCWTVDNMGKSISLIRAIHSLSGYNVISNPSFSWHGWWRWPMLARCNLVSLCLPCVLYILFSILFWQSVFKNWKFH